MTIVHRYYDLSHSAFILERRDLAFPTGCYPDIISHLKNKIYISVNLV